MNWAEYVEKLISRTDAINYSSLLFEDENQSYAVPPISIVTNHIIKSLENKENGRIVFVFPERNTLQILSTIAKVICDILNGNIEKNYDIHSFEKGQKLKLGNCVMEFDGIRLLDGDRKGDNQLRFWVRFSDGMFHGLPLDAIPFLQKAETNRLSSHKTFAEARKQFDIKIKHDSNIELKNYKTFLASTVFFVGSLLSAKIALCNISWNNDKISDVLLLGRATTDGEIINITAGQLSGNPAITLSSDLYSVVCAINKGTTAAAVVIDMATISSIESQLDVLDELKRKKISIIIFTDNQNSFELESLRQRNFLIWKWDSSTITETLISGQNTIFDQKLINCRRFSDEYCLLTESEISESIKILYSYRNEIDNHSYTMIELFGELFGIAFTTLRRVHPFGQAEKEMHNSKIINCERLLASEKNYISDELYNDLSSVIHNFKVAFSDDYSLPKVEEIHKILRRNSCFEKTVYLIVDNRADKGSIDEYWKKQFIQADNLIDMQIVTVTEFTQIQASENSIAIVIGWLNGTTMKKLLFSYNVDSYIVLLYKCESIWKRSHTNNWAKSLKSDNKKILSEIFDCTISDSEVEREEKDVENTSDLIHQSIDFSEDIELILRENKYRHYISGYAKTDDEQVEAIPVNFIGGYLAFFRQSHKLLTLTDVIVNDGEDAKEILPKDLRVGDFIAIRDAERDLAKEIGDVILGNSGRSNARELSMQWKVALEIESIFSSEDEIYRKLKEAGCTKDRMTIRSWLKDDEKIAPREKDDIIAIAKATGDQVLLERADEVFEAAQDVKRAHVQAGQHLSDHLRRKVVDELKKYGEIDSYNIWAPIEMPIENIGTVKILKVIDIADQVYVNITNTNRLIND